MENTSLLARIGSTNPNVLQLYSAPTPNGMKVAACLEELVNLRENFTYEPHLVDIRHGESRASWYKEVAPSGKIPAILDPVGLDGRLLTVFESGAILLYLAEKYDELMPRDPVLKTEATKWLFWGSTNLSSQVKSFGFYYKYCPHRLPYCVERYTKECFRLIDVLNTQLNHGKHWIVGGKKLTKQKSLNIILVRNMRYGPLIFCRHVYRCGHCSLALDLRIA
jgi:GSH-dependent disulfide-bond oxidoreductase